MKRALPAVAAIAVVLAGCGAESEPNLVAAAERTQATGSSAFALTVLQRRGEQTQAFECEGAADFTARRMRLRCGDEGEFLAVGDAFYVHAHSIVGATTGKPWIRLPGEDDELSPHDFAPEALLALLRSASVETRRVGSEEVRGERAVRYRLTVRCDEVELDCETETSDVDVWVDDAGLVRRVVLADGDADITAEYFDFGLQVAIEAPPPSEVGDPVDPVLGPCAGDGEPISAARLGRALTRAGLTQVSEERAECPPGTVARVIGVEGSPTQGSLVLCVVQQRASGDAPSAVRTSSSFGIESLRLRNVQCTPYGSASSEPLRRALDEIARELGP